MSGAQPTVTIDLKMEDDPSSSNFMFWTPHWRRAVIAALCWARAASCRDQRTYGWVHATLSRQFLSGIKKVLDIEKRCNTELCPTTSTQQLINRNYVLLHKLYVFEFLSLLLSIAPKSIVEV
jgi:hypothetical protein